MIQQTGTALVFEFWFTASKQGKAGLADVVVDVYDHTRTKIVTAAAATEVGGGLYTYTLASGGNTGAGNYRAVARTADATVDFQHVPSLWTVGEGWVQDVDAAVSSRSTFAGGAVASVTGNVGGNVAGNVTGSVGSVAGNVAGNVVGSVASVAGNVAGNVTGSVGSVTAGVTVAAAGLAPVLVAGVPLPETLRRVSALLYGVISDAGTNSEDYADQSGAPCVTVVADTGGNRSSVTFH